MGRIFWGKRITKGKGGCRKVRRRTNSSVQGGRRHCREGRQFIVNRMAVLPNLSPLRLTTGNIVLSLLPWRTEAFLLTQTCWNCVFTRKGACSLYQKWWPQFGFYQQGIRWSVSSCSLACLTPCRTVISTVWDTSLLSGNWGTTGAIRHGSLCSTPQSLPIHPRTYQTLPVQCHCQLSLALAWMLHVPVGSSWFSCLWGASTSPAAASCDAEKNRPQGRTAWKPPMPRAFTKQQHALEPHIWERGASVLKHWNMTHFLISTSCRLFGVQIIYFQLRPGKKKKTYTASSILPVYFALCSTTHGIQMTSYWVALQDYFKFFICYGWILKHRS